MSDDKIAGVPAGAFVKGGTTTSAWDKRKQREYAEADQRRKHQDSQRQAVKRAAGDPQYRAALFSMQLSSPAHPKVCLLYKARDSAQDRQSICEIAITAHPDRPDQPDLKLFLVCPKCLERTGRQDDAQLMIQSHHRRFWLDESKAGIWVDSVSGVSYRLAGTVTTDDLCSCTALGCDWKFRIDDSVLYGSHAFRM